MHRCPCSESKEEVREYSCKSRSEPCELFWQFFWHPHSSCHYVTWASESILTPPPTTRIPWFVSNRQPSALQPTSQQPELAAPPLARPKVQQWRCLKACWATLIWQYESQQTTVHKIGPQKITRYEESNCSLFLWHFEISPFLLRWPKISVLWWWSLSPLFRGNK